MNNQSERWIKWKTKLTNIQSAKHCAYYPMIFWLGVLMIVLYPTKRSLALPIIPADEITISENLGISPPSQPTNHSTSSRVFGTKGLKRWYIQGAAATTLDNEEAHPRRFGLIGAGLSKFFINGHSVNLELNTIYFNQPNDDALGLNLALILRWHFIRKSSWSFYIDGGAGVMGTTNNVPSTGSSFNFTPQLGAGTSIGLADDKRLMLGLRWHHISHADLMGSNNPGRDSIMGYVGLSYPR